MTFAIDTNVFDNAILLESGGNPRRKGKVRMNCIETIMCDCYFIGKRMIYGAIYFIFRINTRSYYKLFKIPYVTYFFIKNIQKNKFNPSYSLDGVQ